MNGRPAGSAELDRWEEGAEEREEGGVEEWERIAGMRRRHPGAGVCAAGERLREHEGDLHIRCARVLVLSDRRAGSGGAAGHPGGAGREGAEQDRRGLAERGAGQRCDAGERGADGAIRDAGPGQFQRRELQDAGLLGVRVAARRGDLQ